MSPQLINEYQYKRLKKAERCIQKPDALCISSRLRYLKIERSGEKNSIFLHPNFSLRKWKRSATKVAAVYCLAITWWGGGGHAAAYLVSLCCSWDFNWTPLQIHTLCSCPLVHLIPTCDTFKFAPLTTA